MLKPLTVPDHVRKYAPWSISKADVIEHCSLQFDFKYVQKKEEIGDNHAALIGKAVHTTLELLIRPIQPSDMTDEAVFNQNAKAAFDHAKAFHSLTQDEADELDSFRPNVEKFARKMHKMRAKYNAPPPLLEQKWGMMLDGSKTEFFNNSSFMRGVIDFAMVIPNGDGTNTLFIIDHKSGRRHPIDHFTRQLRSYCVMALNQIPNLRGVQTGIHFVKEGDTELNSYVHRDLIEKEFYPYLVNEIVKAAEKLKEPPKPTPGWYCRWCSYASMCPAKKDEVTTREEK